MAILVATLIDRAKALSDKRNDASIPDSDWYVYVNWGQQSLDRMIAALDPAFRFAQTNFTLTGTAAGAIKDLSSLSWTDPAGNALSGTFAALHGLDRDPDTNIRRTVPRRNFRERNRGALGWWFPAVLTTDIRYDVRFRTLVLTPFEAAAGNYRAYARLGPRLFTSEADATPLDPQLEPYDEFIAEAASRRGLGIEESAVDFSTGRLGELAAEIAAEHTRDDGEATVIADVEDEGFDGYGPV